MRKRMMAFLMALLMVVTILPANFTIVEANDTNGAIYLKVTGASDWNKAGDIKVTVTDSTGKEVDQRFVKTKVDKAQTDSGNTNPDNTNPDNTNSDNTDSGNTNPGNTDTGKDDAAGKDTENTGSESGSDNSNEPAGQADEQQDAKPVAPNSIKIDVIGLAKDNKYFVDISSDGYLFWKKECTAVEASGSAAYTEVAMVPDTYKELAFSTDFNGWKLDTTQKLAVNGAGNNSVKYASSDQKIAYVDGNTGVVTIRKAGKVSFTATLSVGDSYKTITQSDVVIAKLEQTLSFTDTKAEVYVGDEVAAAASSSASDTNGKITYSVVNGEEYITKDTDFANNGKWTAKSYNNSADGVKVTIKAAIAEDDKYNSAENTYTTTIKPYAYNDFRKYCEVVGTSNTASDGKIWYSEVTGIKAKDGYKIKNSDGSFAEEIAIDANNITQGENQFSLVIGQEKKNSENETVSYINEGTVSGAYNYDSVKPTLSIAKDNDADWVNKDVKITASPSDAGSKIAAVKYTVTDEKDKPLLEEKTVNPNADGSYLITLQASKFANKEIKINVTAYDNAGLKSDTQTQIIKFDTALPNAELSLNSNEGKYYFTDKISVGISATDNFSGIAGIKAVYLTDDVTSASGWDIKNIDWDAENVQNLKADAKSVTISFTDTPNAGNVYVKVTDKAGNEKITSLSDDKKFHFDHTAPTVGIAYSSADENTTNDNYSQLKDGVEYYNHDRYAQITVTDASFNKNATQIKVAVDNKNAVNILDNKAEVQGAAIVKTDDEIWTDNKDGSYTAKLKFTGNHLYKIEASSTDLAGNKTQESTVADSKSKEFYIDELAPVGKVQFSTDKTDAGIIGNWWENILNPFTAISIFKQNQLNIVGSVTDKETGNSGIWTVSYYVNKLDTDTVLSEPKLNNLSADKWKEIKINKSDDGYSFCESLDKSYNKYIVYIKIVDNSGNVKYISTEGAIIDNEAPKITDVNIVDSDNQENKLEDENADLWKQSSVCLQLKATDNLSGIDRYEYKLARLNDDGTYTVLPSTTTVTLQGSDLGTLNYSTVFSLLKSRDYAADTKALKATITVYDRANNSSTVEKIINIDKQAPTVTITRDDGSSTLDNSKGWNNDTLTYTVVAKDATSGIKAENENPVINYYIYLNGKKMKTGKVNVIDKKLDASGAYTEVVGNITISKDKAYDSNNLTIDVDTVDVAGNKSVSSADTTVTAKYDFTAPTAKLELQQGVDGDKWFTNGATFTVTAQDNTSGIEKVGYTIKKADGTYVEGSADAPVELITGVESEAKEYTDSISIPDMADYDTDNLTITTYTYDFAGNKTECSQTIKLDTTNPTADLTVNAGANKDGWFNSGATLSVKASDATSGVDRVKYIVKASKDSTVKVTERNFDPAKVIPVIEASAGGAPSISGWTTVSGSGNGDDTVNIATIYYGNDADYTFNISAEDIVGNKSGDVNYGNSLAPTKFTVDKTVPVISVAYDNNNAAEAGFYKEQRTATVTIQEHNFETSRVVLTMNATDNGNPASAPTISGWSGSGDTHTATISFASDAVYTWTLAYTDKAGNKATDLENQSFCVDLTKPAITISGINPNSANNTDGNIGFAIECTDTNFGTFTPVLTAVVYENGSFATKEIEGSASSVGNGERIEYGNLEEDGMYSLRCAAVDKAGNAYDTVNIVDEDGASSTVNLQDGDNLIDFSVNRNGSTFALNDYSMDVVNDYYVQETAEDIVFYETNADELLNYNIKLNGNALKEGNDYKVTESGGDGSWYRYEYAVNKSLFDDEGEYNLVVESEDKATSMAYSDLKNVSADFVIDKTAPTFTISGIEEDGNYRGTSQNVTLVPTDDGGKLGHVKVTILDKDGKEQKVISDMSGDELTKYLNGNDGKIKFKVPEGVNQQVAILCADCSIGTAGGTNTTDFIYKGITVSSNAFILFFENKPLFYGVLGVVAAAIIVPTGFVIYKKKRKTKKEASEQ